MRLSCAGLESRALCRCGWFLLVKGRGILDVPEPCHLLAPADAATRVMRLSRARLESRALRHRCAPPRCLGRRRAIGN